MDRLGMRKFGFDLFHRGKKFLFQVDVVELRQHEHAPETVAQFMSKFMINIRDGPGPGLGHDDFHEISDITHKALHDFLAGPGAPGIPGRKSLMDFHGPGGELVEFHGGRGFQVP